MPIAVVSVPVSDPDNALKFYTKVMGFTLLRDTPMGPDMRWLQLQPTDGGSSIALTTWFDNLKPGGQQGLLIGVPDIDAERARLAGHGVKTPDVQEQEWGRFTTLNDPDGNGWVVAQLTRAEEFA